MTLTAAPNEPLDRAARDKELCALDAIDIDILATLQRQGRIANKGLARLVGLSPSACLARVRRLETSGVIAGYGARISPEAVGVRFEAWALITLGERTPEMLQSLRNMLREERAVVEAYEVASVVDVLLHIVAHDPSTWRAIEAKLHELNLLGSVRIGLKISDLKAPSPWPIAEDA